MQTVDMVRRDILITRRWLDEVEAAISAYMLAGYPDSVETGYVDTWNRTLQRRDKLRSHIHCLEAELMKFGNR